jgi:hypothetical protein
MTFTHIITFALCLLVLFIIHILAQLHIRALRHRKAVKARLIRVTKRADFKN